MSSILSDTNPKVEQIQIVLLRQATPERRLEIYVQLYQMVRQLTFQGLRDRFPNDAPDLLKLRMAELWLGRELAGKVYGRLP